MKQTPTMNDAPGDQFYLSRLQVINWGVFDGYHSIPFSPSGSLITGASGSGKSSLLDAISLAFLPNHRRNFNASGDHTASGSAAGKRTVAKYMLGAWGERSDGGNGSQAMYLRGGDGPAWSAVAVTYRSLSGQEITGLVLKWFVSGATSDPQSRYALAEGDRDIYDLCNHWITADYDIGVLRDAGWRTTKVEHNYLTQLYATIGIRESAAAQQLLGKAKSLKSVGGLEQFVREYMLDEPDSVTRVPEALKQIDPLVEARTLLDIAQRKRKILGDIELVQERYASESASLGVIDIIDAAIVRDHIDRIRLNQCPTEIEILDGHIDQLDAELAERADQRDVLTAERDTVTAQINNASTAIAPLKARLEEADKRSGEVARRRTAYDERVFALDAQPPDSDEDFWALRELFLNEATRIRHEVERGQQTYIDKASQAGTARRHRDAVRDELDRVQRLRSAIPKSETDMRQLIAEAMGVPTSRFPYVAELMDLKPGQDRWRLGVEKVLRSAGLRLLVPDENHAAVLRFVNQTNMRGRIQLQHVRHDEPPRKPGAGTLATKLQVVDPTHECAAEALNVIADVGDYVCVDGPDEFIHHRRAVTDRGLHKTNDRLSIKDDRNALRRSEFIYVGDIEAKIAALQQDLDEAEADYEQAKRAIDELDDHRQQQLQLANDYQAVCERFTEWSEIDTDAAEEHAAQLRQQYDQLLADNPDIDALTKRAEQLWRQIQAVMKDIGRIETHHSELDARRTGLLELTERLKPGVVPDQVRETLETYADRIQAPLDLLNPEPHRAALLGAVKTDRDRLLENRKRSRAELDRIMTTFDTEFEDAIPNDSNDFDERVHDYVAVARHIDERELPEAHARMLRLITEQAPDAILTLHRVAEQEAKRITEQIARVNTGLGSVDFNRGTRLTLRATEHHVAAVTELKEKVTAISQRIAAVSMGDQQAIVEQYKDILTLRQRLDLSTPESRQWTRDALDVRNRFSFDCPEWDATTGELIQTHSNSGDNSGGEQEKLMAFCLAGALSYNLASPDTDDNRPVFAQLMLDEAFSKSDPQFAQQSLSAFRKFGFQLVIVATVQNTTTIQPYIDSVIMVSKTDATTPSARPVASATARSISEFAQIRSSFDTPAAVTAPVT
jgi:uncharacterized protein YPO0396